MAKHAPTIDAEQLKDKKLTINISMEVTLDWLMGPSMQDVAATMHRFASDIAYAGIYKRTEGQFETIDGKVVGNFKVEDIDNAS